MAFTPGHKLSKGRPKGTVNKRTAEFRAVLEQREFVPAHALVDIFEVAMAKFTEEVNAETNGTISRIESNAAKYLKIAADTAKEIASYTHPKLKAIEQTKTNPLEGMTPEQKLEAARQMVKYLEAETKR